MPKVDEIIRQVIEIIRNDEQNGIFYYLDGDMDEIVKHIKEEMI